MSSLVYVSNAVIVAVCIKVIGYFVAICIDRCKTSPFVGVVKAVAICIDACWRDYPAVVWASTLSVMPSLSLSRSR